MTLSMTRAGTYPNHVWTVDPILCDPDYGFDMSVSCLNGQWSLLYNFGGGTPAALCNPNSGTLTATNSATPPGPIEPIAGYPVDGGWGSGSVNTTFVKDVFDLSPWAGATSVTLGIRVDGQSLDASEVRWFFDDVKVVGKVGATVVPGTWTCSASFFGTGDGCDCGCGALDPDCRNALVGACDYCDNQGSCNDGGGCPGSIQAATNALCVVP